MTVPGWIRSGVHRLARAILTLFEVLGLPRIPGESSSGKEKRE
jgi:hypothetical protein